MKNLKFLISICKVTPKVKVLSNKISTRQYISYLHYRYSNTKYQSILKIYTMLCTYVSSTFGLWLHLAHSYLGNSQICYMNVAMFQTRIFLSNIMEKLYTNQTFGCWSFLILLTLFILESVCGRSSRSNMLDKQILKI